MQEYYADLHIHIGEAAGKPVKITASRNLTLKNIIFESAPQKGLDIVGIVDAGTLPVKSEIEEMLLKGDLVELASGGFLARNGVLLIAGAEVESREGIHLIIYFPSLMAIKEWQKVLSPRVTNMNLSTQHSSFSTNEIIALSIELNAIFCPAHAFTPHKGIYGMWTDKIAKIISENFKHIKVLELGLSADTNMADTLSETYNMTFLSNSDAHSAVNVAREYNLLLMQEKNFEEFRKTINRIDGREVKANYGLHPLLGKYHRTYCPACSQIFTDPRPVLRCPLCRSDKVVMGVYDRILMIRDYPEPQHPGHRPPYYYRVPLKDIPGIGPKTLSRLQSCYSEIQLLEKANIEDISTVVDKKTAQMISKLRSGDYRIIPGGGGKYGKIRKD